MIDFYVKNIKVIICLKKFIVNNIYFDIRSNMISELYNLKYFKSLKVVLKRLFYQKIIIL